MAKARTLVLNTKVNVTGADQLRGLGKTLQKTGRLLTVGLTLPLVGVGAAMLTAAQDAERAQAKLTNVFDSMGAAAFTSVKALNAHAEALQNATTFDDESINEAQAVLLTFGNVTGKAFTRATEAALDLSSLFEGDLQAATIQIGKALNDPIKGLTALSKVGVSFTQQQKDQIKALQQSGDLLGAQTIILAELERQFGGTAEALAGTAGGQMTQALNQLGEASEEFGKIIAPVLLDVAKGLKGFAKWLQQLNPETKEWVLRIGLLAAALGPVLIVVGTLVRTFAALRTAGLLLARVAPLIGASFHLMLGPLGLVTAGVTALAAAFATDFLGVRTRFEKDMGDIGDILGDAGDAFRGFFGIVTEEEAAEKAGWAAYQDRIDSTITAAANIVETGVGKMARAFREGTPAVTAEVSGMAAAILDILGIQQAKVRNLGFQHQVEYAKGLLDAQNNVKVAIEAALQITNDLMTKQEEINYLSGQRGTLMIALGIAEAEGKPTEALEGALGLLRQRLGELGVEFYTSGRNAGLSFGDGLTSAYSHVRTAANTLGYAAGRILGVSSEPDDPRSPLHGITKWGGNIGKTLAEGMLRAVPDVSSASAAIAGAIGFGKLSGLAAVPAAGGGSMQNITNVYLTVHGALTVDDEDSLRRTVQRAATTW